MILVAAADNCLQQIVTYFRLVELGFSLKPALSRSSTMPGVQKPALKPVMVLETLLQRC